MSDAFALRPVQSRAIEMMRASIKGGRKRPQLQLPTGSGKTIIAGHMVRNAREKKKRVAFTVPLLSLVDQTMERFESVGIDREDIGVQQGDHEWFRPHAPIQICSVQTLVKRDFPATDLVIVDESHLQFKRIYEWMDQAPDKIFVGLSATPWAAGMADHYDDLLVPATIRQMIADGGLCKYKAYAPTKPDLSGVAVEKGDYVQAQLMNVMGRPQIIGDVVENWLERAQDRPTMLFAVNRAHAAMLHDRLCKYDVKSAYVDSFTSREDRITVRDLFERGEIKVICSVGTMNAGVDLPSVSCIVFARPTKSTIFYVQAIGRGLRPHADKDHLLILDHTSTTLDLGLPDEIGFNALRDGELRSSSGPRLAKPLASPRECPDCGVIVAALERKCSCGHEFKLWANVDQLQGELYEIGGDTPEEQRTRREEMSSAEKKRFYLMLMHYAKARGYKDGWAFMKYRQRMGEATKPPWAWRDLDPVPPSNLVLAWIVRMTNQFKRSAAR